MHTTLTANEAAEALDVDVSRVLILCQAGRLGYTLPKHGRAWVITMEEIHAYKHLGPRLAGRPKKEQHED